MTIGAIADGETVKRVGTELVGASMAYAPATMDRITVDTTTTAVITAPATLLTRSFTKLRGASESNLLIMFDMSGDSDTNDRGILFQVRVAGVNRSGTATAGKNNAQRNGSASTQYLETGRAAGAVTIDVQWYVETGSGATGRIRPVTEPTDSAVLIIQEVPA